MQSRHCHHERSRLPLMPSRYRVLQLRDRRDWRLHLEAASTINEGHRAGKPIGKQNTATCCCPSLAKSRRTHHWLKSSVILPVRCASNAVNVAVADCRNSVSPMNSGRHSDVDLSGSKALNSAVNAGWSSLKPTASCRKCS